MAAVDIFVGNNTLIDQEVFQLWLSGYTAHEAAHILQRTGVLQQYGATMDMLLNDILDHYRTFAMLEPLIKHPTKLAEQLEFQIAPDTQILLIEKYYEFSPSVIREILGKKLSARNRNSLDDVSEKTKIALRSCRRQFDNVKRVFKTVEDMMGSLVDNIQSHFKLSHVLARQYAAIVFITNNRFESGKKKLAYLTFEDFAFCADDMITNWSYSSKDCKAHQDMDVDMDRDFMYELRELKTLAEKEHLDEHKGLVLKKIEGKISTAAYHDLENNFKTLSKTLINIAYGLNHSKELRDLFLDLVEKFIEPCKHGGFSTSDVRIYLEVYRDTCYQMEFYVRYPNLWKVWERYLNTVIRCILKMYHS